ncbi:MAG: hypothetical protein GX279_00685 [Clostridiaceae bacterium]|nr:hypothetical protein [Clostridiaceae bacterium]
MIIFIIILFVVAAGIYTFSYGIYLAKKEKNALAAFGTIFLSLITVAAPVIMLILKY